MLRFKNILLLMLLLSSAAILAFRYQLRLINKGRTISVELPDDATVPNLKEAVAKELGESVENIRIFHHSAINRPINQTGKLDLEKDKSIKFLQSTRYPANALIIDETESAQDRGKEIFDLKLFPINYSVRVFLNSPITGLDLKRAVAKRLKESSENIIILKSGGSFAKDTENIESDFKKSGSYNILISHKTAAEKSGATKKETV